MNKMFEKLVAKKKSEGKEISPTHKKAKGDVLNDLMDHLGGMGMDKVKGIKKVSVSSDSKQGLKKGLEKAKEMLGSNGEEMSSEDEALEASEESPEHEMAESSEEESEEMEEGEEKSKEELMAEIEELKAKLAEMKA